ncbi:hypothetical protein RF11_09367 [Thelohanellus kitauei]|uniref:Uncharacterized protein n=1 Tax=Thelohanellus kitauei TaxID=669202 RepID=A0A0C2IXX5_THEKT|nr:hypothetical protein RF11_09367 [Thelohanellus kitauei]
MEQNFLLKFCFYFIYKTCNVKGESSWSRTRDSSMLTQRWRKQTEFPESQLAVKPQHVHEHVIFNINTDIKINLVTSLCAQLIVKVMNTNLATIGALFVNKIQSIP